MWNYFSIKWLCETLKNKLKGFSIGEIFTQNKNEVVIGFFKKDHEDFYWILNFEPSFPHMRFSEDYSRAKRNSVDLFKEILELKILEIVMHEGERSFHFNLQNGYQLIFKLHGGRSNVILKKDNLNYLFRSNIETDKTFEIPENNTYEYNNRQFSNSKELKSSIPILDNTVIHFLEKKGFFEMNQKEQTHLLTQLFEQLNHKKIFLYREKEHWQLHQIKPELESTIYTDIVSAINDYSGLESKCRYISDEKLRILKELKAASDKLRKAVFKMEQRLGHLKNNNEWEENANLIMANLHEFRDGKGEAEIFNFYNDKTIKIKIKKGLSAQKYAESLYKKSKNKGIEIENLEKSISRNNKEIEILELKIKEVQTLKEPKEIKAWVNKKGLKSSKNNQLEESGYKEFKINGFDIFVGRNARNNDQLTTKFAKKDDLWMHAKDVSGSHLIIKKDKNKRVPSDVIEKAASIAAWYSKGKNDTLFPVIYTERKYVRKAKGLAPGQVFVDKYDVVIVKPELP